MPNVYQTIHRLLLGLALLALFSLSGLTRSGEKEDDEPCMQYGGRKFAECTENKFAKADKELNEVYRELLKALPKKKSGDGLGVTQSDLISAQRAWIRQRNADCFFTGTLPGGSWEWINGKIDFCRTYKTIARTKELTLWLGCVKGEEDENGPLCGAL